MFDPKRNDGIQVVLQDAAASSFLRPYVIGASVAAVGVLGLWTLKMLFKENNLD